MQPRSRGRLKLVSRDPRDTPQIDPALLSHPKDLDEMIDGVKLARQIAASAPLKNHLNEEKWPGSAVRTEREIAAAARTSVVPYNHPVGTCRMGKSDDPGAVVSSRGRVYRFEGLHVADASIMPTIPATNTNVPVIMVAERIASFYLEHQNDFNQNWSDESMRD